MNFDFSVTTDPQAAQPLALRTVYRLQADRTYDVRKRGVGNRDIVALRTTAGMGLVSVEGCPEMKAQPGTLLFFEHDRVRRYCCAGDRWDFWWFEFSSVELSSLPMCRSIPMEPVQGEWDNSAACLELLGRATPGTAKLASATFSVLFCKWLLRLETEQRAGPHRQAVEAAIEAMRAAVDKPVSIGSLAHAAGLCERRFRQVFLETTGVQPKKYHEALRMGLAEELLRNTSLSAGLIAERLGYSSPFHFSKAFRAAHGVPPTQFRTNGFQHLNL